MQPMRQKVRVLRRLQPILKLRQRFGELILCGYAQAGEAFRNLR